MASDLDLAGSVILRDEFSGTLGKLQSESKAAEAALESLGKRGDTSVNSAAARMAELDAQLKNIRGRELKTGALSDEDVAAYRAAYTELKNLKAGMAGVTQTSGALASAAGSVAPEIAAIGEAGGLIASGLAGMAAAALKTAYDVGTLGIAMQRNEARFVSFSGSATQAAANLAAMQMATEGAMTRQTAMEQGARLLSMGLASSAEQAGQLARMAIMLGGAGRDASAAIEDFELMLANQSLRRLDQFGISAAQVRPRIEELMAADRSLTREQAFVNAVLEVGAQKMQQLEASGVGAATSTQQLAANFQDLKDTIATGLAPAVDDFNKQLLVLLNAGSGDKVKQLQALKMQLAEAQKAVAEGQQPPAVTMAGPAGLTGVLDQIKFGMVQAGIYQQRVKDLQRQIADLEREIRQATGLEVDMPEQLARAAKAAAEKEASAAQPYLDALNATYDKLAGVTAASTNLGNAIGQMRAQALGLAAMPPIGKGLLDTDVRAWWDYINALEQAGVIRQEDADNARRHVVALGEEQEQLTVTARGMANQAAALDLVAKAKLGDQASTEELINAYASLDADTQLLVRDLGGFGAAIDLVAQKSTGLTALWTNLSQLGGQLKAIAQTQGLQTPEGPKNLGYDTGPLVQYLNTLEQINPASRQFVQGVREQVAVFQSAQDAVLAYASTIDDPRQKLDYLTRAFINARGGIDTFIAGLDGLPASVQAGIASIGGLEAAIAALQAQAEQPVSLGVEVKGLQQSLADVDNMALRLAGTMSPQQIAQWRDRARSGMIDAYRQMGTTTEWGMRLQETTVKQGLDKQVSDHLTAYNAIETATEDHAAKMRELGQQVQSRIQQILSGGLEVTEADMLATNAGKYQTVAMENARRLQAVAERGFQELKIHPDWAAALKIPPEILAGSEADLKAWAARTRQDVVDLTRPDLIDWNKFIADYQKALDREAAKGLTVDIAVSKLKDKGLLKDVTPEDKKKIAQALGLAMPAVTFDSEFAIPDAPKARGKLITDLLGPEDALPIPVKLIYPVSSANQPENQSGLPPGAPGAPPAKTQTTVFLPTIQKPELETSKAVGAQVAADLMTGLDTWSKTQQPASLVAGAWAADFTANAGLFEAIGTGAGNAIGNATRKALLDNVKNVRAEMAALIAPEVAEILSRKKGSKANE